MKRKIPSFSLITLLLVGCSNPLTIHQVTVNGVFSTYIDCKYDVGDSFSFLDQELESFISSFGKEVDDATNRINATNEKVTVNEEVFRLIEAALDYQEKTSGYFDPLLGKVNYLWKDYLNSDDESESLYLKTKEEAEKAFQEVKNSSLQLNASELSVKRNGKAQLDLGGIAKGYCLKKVKEKILAAQSKHYLINGGSSSLAMGLAEGDTPFRVRLENTGDSVFRYSLSNIDSSTSSTLSQCKKVPLEGETYLSHIVNPKTGNSEISEHAMTFFVGEDSAMLDAFSTASIFAPLSLIQSWEKQYDIQCSIFDFENANCVKLVYENPSLVKAK